MKISVVIPLFNKRRCLKRCIDSVLSQDYPIDQLIIVNDGSTDGGELVLRNILDPRIRLINQMNQGVAMARNRGIEEAKTDHICLLDADDEWLPGFVSEMVKLISEYPHAIVYSVRHQKVNEDGKISQVFGTRPSYYSGTVQNFPSAFKKDYGIINSSSVCIKKSLRDQGLEFPIGEKKGEDIYYWLRASQLGEIAISNRTLSIYHLDVPNGPLSYETNLPYHIKWYLSDRKKIRKGNHGKDICRFILSNALVHAYGSVADSNYSMCLTIMNAFIKAADIRAALFLPALICPPRLMKLARMVRRRLQ